MSVVKYGSTHVTQVKRDFTEMFSIVASILIFKVLFSLWQQSHTSDGMMFTFKHKIKSHLKQKKTKKKKPGVLIRVLLEEMGVKVTTKIDKGADFNE